MFRKNSTTRMQLLWNEPDLVRPGRAGYSGEQNNRSGFSVIELSVIVAIVILFTVVTVSYSIQAGEKRRDTHRRTELNKFAQKIEEYKTAHGVYPCGDSCSGTILSDTFTYDCSDGAVDSILGAEPDERNGFLNGGNCCVQTSNFYSPTTTNDDWTWGLYKRGNLSTYTILDPRQGSFGGAPHRYCYSTLADSRAGYLLTVRLESSKEGETDDGFCNGLYEIKAGRYPSNGWKPEDCSRVSGIIRCGDAYVEPPEQCDDGNTTSNDGCSASCIREYCGDGIIQTGIGENCDPPINPETLCAGGIHPFDYCGSTCTFVPLFCDEPIP